jgi:hypothetical protein
VLGGRRGTTIARVSRFRLAFLLTFVLAAALPMSAHARRLPYCHLFSTDDVAHATGYRGVRVSGQIRPSLTITTAPSRTTQCLYASGVDALGEADTLTFNSVASTAKEYRAEIRAHNGAESVRATRMSGPWKSAYRYGNNEIYVLKGRHIFFLTFQLKLANARRIRSLALKAAQKL